MRRFVSSSWRRGNAPARLLLLTVVLALGCDDPLAVDAPAMRSVAAEAPADGGTSPDAPRLYYLDVRGRVLSARVDGSDVRALVTGQRGTPDGIAVDPKRGHVYWTLMGAPSGDDGAIYRADLDGGNVTPIVRAGGTFTPKQLTIDVAGRALYWSDREGMRVMRCALDGSGVETLVATGQGAQARRDASNWAVGIAIDVAGGYVYWTQKGPADGHRGSIRRAPLVLARGETAATRTDVEVLFEGLPEPIDLALDLVERRVYWTDRGDNTVNRAPLDLPPGASAATRSDRSVLVRGLSEAIGISLNLAHDALYYTDLGGTVGTSHLDGSGARPLLRGQGSLTGITYVGGVY